MAKTIPRGPDPGNPPIGAAMAARAPRPRHALDELLAQCDETAPPDAEDRAWLDARPVGNELP